MSDGDAIREALHRWGKVLESDETGVWDAAARELDALVARLAEAERERDEALQAESLIRAFENHLHMRLNDADSRVAELERERDETRQQLAMCVDSNVAKQVLREMHSQRSRAEAAEARVAALTEALREISRLGHHGFNRGRYLKDAEFHALVSYADRALAAAAGEPEAATP